MIENEGGAPFHAPKGSTNPSAFGTEAPLGLQRVGTAVWVPNPVEGSHWMLFLEGREEAAMRAAQKHRGLIYSLSAGPL